MKILLMTLTALVICSAGLFSQPPVDTKGEGVKDPKIFVLTEGNPSPQIKGHEPDFMQNSQLQNENSGDSLSSESDTLVDSESLTPAGLELSQNYPNPFNFDTEIKYGLPARSSVQIAVYNIFGKKVRTIKDTIEDSGYYSVNWDGRDDNGALLASGMYFYVFASDDNYLTRKMLFLK
jgi:hypothetical protein